MPVVETPSTEEDHTYSNIMTPQDSDNTGKFDITSCPAYATAEYGELAQTSSAVSEPVYEVISSC